jgi:ribosome-binding protein aMBF1 (putative translation factor)
MSNLGEKLSKLASDQPSGWMEKAKYRRENRAWLKKAAVIALKVLSALKAQGITQKELAERMNVSPQQISKIVSGQENLTLETIVRLEAALGITILEGLTDQSKSVA